MSGQRLTANMSVDELRGQVQAYQALLAEVQERLGRVESASAAKDEGSAKEVKIKEIARSAAGATPLQTLSDVPHRRESNPVVRPPSAPVAAAVVDLDGERGHRAVSRGSNRSMLYEYVHWASYMSYLYDLVQAFEEQVAGVSDNTVRKSFSVLYTGFSEVLRRGLNRLDFLKILSEHGTTQPGLVAALEAGLNGEADLPVTSNDVINIVQRYRNQVVTASVSAGAKAEVTGGRGRGRGRGDRGRGRGGRGGRGDYYLRERGESPSPSGAQ